MDSSPKNSPGSSSDDNRMPFRGMALWFLLLAGLLFIFQMFSQGPERVSKIPYNPDFLALIEEGKIQKAEIVMEMSGFRFVRGELKEIDEKTGRPKKFKVNIASTDEVQKRLTEKGIPFEVIPQNPYLWQVLSGAIPFLLVMGLLYFLFMRQMRIAGKGAMSFGKSRAKLLQKGKNRITFADIAGVEEAEEEVTEIVEFLKDPKRYQKLGGRIPKGVLLVGPPGTGKTLLAKAIAGEANVPFFSISGSDFVEMFVGVGASRVRDMFEQARKHAPCIIFIDEIDAVGRSRFSGIGGGHDEREQTLNALLVEMDGFDTQEGIIIIAATNRPDVLDNALLRPGRFDRQIVVDLPSLEGREAILKIHTKKVRLAKDVDLRRIARGTPGFSGADLANLVNEAALLAARRGAEFVEMKDLEEARDKVRWGRERRSRLLDEQEKRLTAYHEAGHAIVLALQEESEPLHKVTIIPRGQALGATMQLPEKDRYTQGRRKLLGMLVGLMGGRAAEELACSDITTGAQNDLKQATRLARMMVCDWGMSPELGPQSFGEREELLFLGREVSRSQDYSEATAQKIDQEVNRMLREAYAKAIEILRTHRDKLDLVARMLIERETLEGYEVMELIRYGRLLSEAERQALSNTAPPPSPAPSPSAVPVTQPASREEPVLGANPTPSPA
ncbi:MAG: ATP-dependent zinc metalloprotease FtsH [Kiritimatiellae bacterium]|nr:ATP-dependent zinc metalloprotease FtsH [Kiritimatiellia bacterium]MDW8457994.1 ATP-dependent zinc metalloprotease FtsH [Verrucomicrobiota bacterium]